MHELSNKINEFKSNKIKNKNDNNNKKNNNNKNKTKIQIHVSKLNKIFKSKIMIRFTFHQMLLSHSA